MITFLFLQENPFENPIIVLQDVSFTALSAIISYMYNGEVSVTEEYLPILVKTAECLQIKGLSMADNVDDEIESESTHCDKLESTIETIIIKQEVVSDDENCCIENVDVILDEVINKFLARYEDFDPNKFKICFSFYRLFRKQSTLTVPTLIFKMKLILMILMKVFRR